MLRSSRTILSLISSLTLGTTTLASTALVTSTLVGCKDEGQPEYWVEKLDDQAWRARAVNKLGQFFEDAMTRNDTDLKAAPVQELVNKIIDPLTKSYVEHYDQFDTKTRVALIQLLSAFRDKRSEPALKKAFDEFVKHPSTSKDEQDIKWAARAAGDLKAESLADSLAQVFVKLRASSMLGGIVYKDLNEAMIDMPAKSWVGPLTTKLEADITPPGKSKELIDPYRDQLFWQTTAAELLGRIGDPAAVTPLLKVMLDPNKADVQATAVLALVKLGRATVDRTGKLIRGEDKELADFALRRLKEISGREVKGTPHVATAAVILGATGRADALPPLLAALANEKDPSTKAVIARELSHVPATAESKAAFKAAFESFTLETEIPPSGGALEALSEAAGQFYDSDFVDWLLERARATKGSPDDLKPFQLGAAITALKLARPAQLPAVKAAISAYGTALEKSVYQLVEAQVKACTEDVGCYLSALTKAENQEEKTQFAGIKAGYMVAILGNDKARDELAGAIDGISNGAVRFVAAQALDHLAPNGAKSVTDKLSAVIDKNAKSPDRAKSANDAPLKQVLYRIQARGG